MILTQHLQLSTKLGIYQFNTHIYLEQNNTYNTARVELRLHSYKKFKRSKTFNLLCYNFLHESMLLKAFLKYGLKMV